MTISINLNLKKSILKRNNVNAWNLLLRDEGNRHNLIIEKRDKIESPSQIKKNEFFLYPRESEIFLTFFLTVAKQHAVSSNIKIFNKYE